MHNTESFDVAVIGGGPAGATAAAELAAGGHSVLLLDKAGRIKPCGGAIPPKLIEEFDIPAELLVARIRTARVVSPTARSVDMPINGGFVGMVDRDVFDEWLRERAAARGALRRTGRFDSLVENDDGTVTVRYHPSRQRPGAEPRQVRARAVIGADGANSAVARHAIPGADHIPQVAAYHEIIRSPEDGGDFDGARCDVIYRASVSPDFYGWVFPHGETTSVGVGSAHKGLSLRGSVERLRADCGLAAGEVVRREGAPIPLKALKRWDNGRNILVTGDAAGAVAPASGEGIYYAMCGGRHAAQAVDAFCASGDARALRSARKRFMKSHGRVFFILGMMQWFWYANDKRRERFVSICRDPDVQRLTWEAYMNKKLVKASPATQARIFFKDLAHLAGVVRP